MSIWENIDRASFKKDLALLHEVTNGRDVTLPATFPSPAISRDGWLPFLTEKQLAEDFAFLASNEDTPACVSAATLSQDRRNGTTNLHIAANQGVKAVVRSTLQQIVDTMRHCADRTLSQDDMFRKCLDLVLDLHANRILGRIGSTKYVRPKDSTNYRTLRVTTVLNELVTLLGSTEAMHELHVQKLAEEIAELLLAMEEVECSIETPNRETLKKVVRCAYLLHIGDDAARFSLIDRLEHLGVTKHAYEGRLARQLQAVANYWRICLYFAMAARSYHRLLRTIQLCVLTPGPKKRTVHAEIQLLVYHEVNERLILPSIIPASKKPCLLCYAFMKGHGLYRVLESHGEVFRNWHVPDREMFSRDTKARLNAGLRGTNTTMRSVLTRMRSQPVERADPKMRAQSYIASELDMLRTPSVSTIRPEYLDNVAQRSRTTNAPMPSNSRRVILPSGDDTAQAPWDRLGASAAPDKLLQAAVNTLPKRARGLQLDSAVSPKDCAERVESSSVSSDPDEAGSVALNQPATLNLGLLELHVEFETAPSPNHVAPQFSSATCRLQRGGRVADSDIVINLETLRSMEELRLSNEGPPGEMRLILRIPGLPDTVLECCWNG